MSRASQNMNLGDLKAFVAEAESINRALQIIAREPTMVNAIDPECEFGDAI
jgi:hypothetical protein